MSTPQFEIPPRAWPRTVLLEVSWEVCNQIGGIYQVLSSKASLMVERWQHHYFLVGPYFPDHASIEYESARPAGWLGRTVETLAGQGLVVHFGRWLVSGKPRVLLLEHRLSNSQLDELKQRLSQDFGIESASGDPLVDDALAFAEAVRKLFEAVCQHWMGPDEGTGKKQRRVLGHFHEWLTGPAIPMLRKARLPVATVFTTHATLLGRYISSSTGSFYERLPKLDPLAEATHYHIQTQHQIERACALDCDVFTTVSPLTGEECTSLLGRPPDVITPNGLNISRYDIGPDFHSLHGLMKENIHRFTMAHFFPSYTFNLDHTLYFFTAGRFEPSNKGFDLCLEAMARLNAELKSAKLDVTVVFFVISPQPTISLDPHALHDRAVLDELHEVAHRMMDGVGERLFTRSAAGARPQLDELVDEYWLVRLRRTQQALRSNRLPLVVTHLLTHPENDPILKHIRALRLQNRAEDPVKVVYHPAFITSVNPLWGIEYDQFVRGCHLGIFPSQYEPWGYTPLECIAMGVPTVTSDLAGFGRYLEETWPDHDRWGVSLLRRRGRNFNEAAADLTRKLLAFCRLDRRARIALRGEVERRSRQFDWSMLGRAHHHAHDRALGYPTWADTADDGSTRGRSWKP